MNLKAIEHKIEKTAFQLFRVWTKRALRHYPDLNFVIKDEKILVDDLKDSIISSLEALYKSDKFDDLHRAISWDVGFVLGFMQGKLDTHWFHEYIEKRSEEYKQIMILTAIKRFFAIEELPNIRLLHLYRRLIKEDINLREFDINIPEINIDIRNYDIENSKENIDDLNLLDSCIEKIRVEKIFKFANRDKPNFLPEFDKYFTQKQIQKLISANIPNH